MKTSPRAGFTLIELLVVIAIIGLLSSVVFAATQAARARAYDARRISDIKQVKTALELYYSANEQYPSVGDDNSPYELSSLAGALNPYLKKMPENLGPVTYKYTRGGPNSYGILVTLQNESQCVSGLSINSGWWAGPPGGGSVGEPTTISRCNF